VYAPSPAPIAKRSAYQRSTAFSYQVQLHDGTPSRWVSAREANEKLAKGEAIRIKRKAHQPYEIIRLKKQVEPSSSESSPCCITPNDMQINVGAIECNRFHLEALRVKLEEFRTFPLLIVMLDFSPA
jgi:hypothetical protein